MKMRIELLDTLRQRIAVFNEAISLEATRCVPDLADTLKCTVPHVEGFGPGCTIDVYLDNTLWQRYETTCTQLRWDADFQPEHATRRPLRDVMLVEAQAAKQTMNTRLRRAYVGVTLEEALMDVINRAPGSIHYLINHDAYPDGATREYGKFLGRISPDNELEPGGISEGQWVDAGRIDASEAYAKDGDTISGIKVDGVLWPDVRLMMIDAEETTLNNHARQRHPETALWSSERYANSGYKLSADRAKAFLQHLLDTKGISHIELNPHRDSNGDFDDRVDAYGRYIGRVFGDGECFSAALVEQGLADVYLYEDGQYHVPEHLLKEFFSYTGAHTNSYPTLGETIHAVDLDCGALEALTLLAYLCGGQAFSITPELGVTFQDATLFDHQYRYRADKMAVTSGFANKGLVNTLAVTGNTIVAPDTVSVSCDESIDAYGASGSRIDGKWLGSDDDKAQLAENLVHDLAYPSPSVTLTFFGGAPELLPGALVSVTGAPLARYARRLPDEWGDAFDETLVGRVVEVRHVMTGKDARTEAILAAPLRSVKSPLTLLRRIRSEGEPLFSLRLDEAMAGLDQDVFYLG